MSNEVERFVKEWDRETQNTLKLLRSLPEDKYDFRPDAGGRSLGELAWHLAEVDAYVTHGIERGKVEPGVKPPNIERPRKISELPARFQVVHDEAVARVRKLKPEDMTRTTLFFDGNPMPINAQLWGAVLMHSIHHRGQLVLMCRLAGGMPPGIYGPTREQMAAMRAQA